MKRHIFSALFAALGLACAVPTFASRDSRRAEDAAYGRKVMRDFAKCNVKYEHALARKYVLTNPTDRMPPEEFWRVADARCLGFLPVQLRMPQLYYRAALAEELFRREFPNGYWFDAMGIDPLGWTAPAISLTDPRTGRGRDPEELHRIRASVDADAAAGRLGECVVRASTFDSLGVVRSSPESPDELKALRALAPQIARCVQAGQTARFNRTNLRAAIVLSYYRLSWAAAAGLQQAAVK